jgi:hypothetical protein
VGLASNSGCALLASANAQHSRVTPCIDEPTYAIVDFVLGGITAAAVGAGGLIDDSMAWIALPGVFFASGILGGISVHMCDGAGTSSGGENTQLTNSAPDFGDAPVDPDVPMATVEDMVAPPQRANLELAPDYDPKAEPSQIPCGVGTACPEHQSCWILSGHVGHCVPDAAQSTQPVDKLRHDH